MQVGAQESGRILQEAISTERKRAVGVKKANANKADATRKRIMVAEIAVGSKVDAIQKHLKEQQQPVHDEKTIRKYRSKSGVD